jgi:hypothetical protein
MATAKRGFIRIKMVRKKKIEYKMYLSMREFSKLEKYLRINKIEHSYIIPVNEVS